MLQVKATLTASADQMSDIVYVPLLKSFFEIQFVEDQGPFYQLGNLPVYKLKVTRWEYANEEINTGINTLDAVEDKPFIKRNKLQISIRVCTKKY